MNKVLIQLQRELWESRASLVRTPVILAGVLMALLVVGIFTTQRHVQNIGAGAWMELKMDGDAVEFSELLFSGDLFQIHPNILTTGLASFQAIFVLILLLTIPFYLLSCLYTDRRDQSILFWKSLPVSETRSVLTKLGTAVFLAPAIYTLGHRYRHVLYIAAPAIRRPRPGNTHAWIWYINIRTGKRLSDGGIGLVIVGALVHASVLLVHAGVGRGQENAIHLGDGPASGGDRPRKMGTGHELSVQNDCNTNQLRHNGL